MIVCYCLSFCCYFICQSFFYIPFNIAFNLFSEERVYFQIFSLLNKNPSSFDIYIVWLLSVCSPSVLITHIFYTITWSVFIPVNRFFTISWTRWKIVEFFKPSKLSILWLYAALPIRFNLTVLNLIGPMTR